MKKKMITRKLMAVLLTLTMVLALLPTAALAAEEAHTKEGYTSVWSEDFENGIPGTWSKEDKDKDGFNWKWSSDVVSSSYNAPCHGEWCILSESYDKDEYGPLMPDNWLYLPSLTLRSGKEYLLTFMMAAQDFDAISDKVGVYVSTNGGTTYTQIGNDYVSKESRVWEEVAIDLSKYAGQTVKLAVVHHNCTDEYVTKLDCFNLWEKEGELVHTKEGYTSVWSEGFEDGIPSTWSMVDKDKDGFNWNWSSDTIHSGYKSPCHGDWCVFSESYSNSNREALRPDNWLYLPSLRLTADKDYLLTFMMAAQDTDCFHDRVGVYISTNGGTSYTQIGKDHISTTPDSWEEVEVDLSEYAGTIVDIAVVHHNCTDEYVTKLDCFNLWEKAGNSNIITRVEANGTQVPVAGESADWTMPTFPAGAKYHSYGYYAWVETDFEVTSYTDFYDFEKDDWKNDGSRWYYYGDEIELTFKEGKYYTLCIWLDLDEGFSFAPSDKVSGKIDGDEAGFVKLEADDSYTLFRTYGPLLDETDPCAIFTDINRSAWYHNAVDFAIASGLMSGMPNNIFAPTGKMTRAQLVQILYNLEGKPAVTYKKTFTDVKESAWYADAVLWAAENGVVSGVGNNRFNPSGYVTREQMATILFRYFGAYNGQDVSARADLKKFPDEQKVSSWAYEALQWANAEGLINGISSGGVVSLSPKGTATRAQVAQVFYNYVTN